MAKPLKTTKALAKSYEMDNEEDYYEFIYQRYMFGYPDLAKELFLMQTLKDRNASIYYFFSRALAGPGTYEAHNIDKLLQKLLLK